MTHNPFANRSKAHCNQCDGSRWHEVLFYQKDQTPGEDSRVSTYELLRCAGCEEIKLRTTILSGDDRHTSTKVKPEITYYPPSTIRRQPVWFTGLMLGQLDGDVTTEYDLLREVYAALRNGAPALAAMGIRAVVETVMIKKTGDNKSFEANLTAMRDRGLVSELDVQHLRQVLEVGHAAIHRSHLPSVEDALRALDIAETLVKRLYLDKNTIDALKKSTPQRRTKGDGS